MKTPPKYYFISLNHGFSILSIMYPYNISSLIIFKAMAHALVRGFFL
jgi:hypothetical protein